MSREKAFDQTEDLVDPRVQVELERLNTATDEINKLEVDLDEARNQFRQLLVESTIRINGCSKKLGNCIEKARPYYDARIKAKEALQETQKAAVNFERANSAHAAAKEMVYLAEEGLKTEGRTFDHAWQEMLNHATMRVNESESERTRSEAEHKRTSQNYQKAEVRVQRLQKELKKAISKSRPYFELKIHYTQLLEQQKYRVKNLEKQVSNVKLCYADTLKNLEHISDEIHKTRQKSISVKDELTSNGNFDANEDFKKENELGSNVTNAISSCAKEPKNFHTDVKTDDRESGKTQEIYETNKVLSPISETSTTKYTSFTSGSSLPDTDSWSDKSGAGNIQGNAENGVDSSVASPNSGNDSPITEPPDPESEDELYKFPNPLKLASKNHESNFKEIDEEIRSRRENMKPKFFEGVGICSFPVDTELNINFEEGNSLELNHNFEEEKAAVGDQSNNWTEIKLHSPDDEPFPTIKKGRGVQIRHELEEDYDIPYSPLSEMELATNYPSNFTDDKDSVDEPIEKNKTNISLNSWIGKNLKNGSGDQCCDDSDNAKSQKGTPRKMNIRRQSLDVLWNNATGEKVKEIISQGILKLSIGSLSERRGSESKIGEDSDSSQNEGPVEGVRIGDGTSYESNLTSQFGLQFFTKRNAKSDDNSFEERKSHSPQESISNQIGGFITRKEKFFTKKVPSPLEKTLSYLNADDDSNSDSESLASSDMLTDEQLASLVLDRDLTEIYQDIIT